MASLQTLHVTKHVKIPTENERFPNKHTVTILVVQYSYKVAKTRKYDSGWLRNYNIIPLLLYNVIYEIALYKLLLLLMNFN